MRSRGDRYCAINRIRMYIRVRDKARSDRIGSLRIVTVRLLSQRVLSKHVSVRGNAAARQRGKQRNRSPLWAQQRTDPP